MEKRWIMAVVLGVLVLATGGCINLRPLLVGEMRTVTVRESPRRLEPNRVALIDVSGFIGSGGGLLPFAAGTPVADVREKLERAAADRRVRAIVVRIESPGGEVTASDTVYREIVRFKEETGKPVVAALQGTAASGGYYVALSADHIVATPTSVTGSVGVIIRLLNVEALFGKIGLDSQVVKSGEKKDMASPTRPPTDEEMAILQGVTDQMFARFVEIVRRNRPDMTSEALELISDGRIMMAAEALELGMVDEVGYLDEAIDASIRLAGVEHAEVVLYRPFPHYNTNIYASAGPAAEGTLLEEGIRALLRQEGPAFLYLWAPGL